MTPLVFGSEIVFEVLGRHQLRGVPTPWELSRVVEPTQDPPVRSGP